MTYPTVTTLPPGDAGVDQTLRYMAQSARAAASAQPHGWGRRNLWWNLGWKARCRALRQWLLDHTQFQDDPPGVERVRHPMEMLRAIEQGSRAAGDCDDIAALAAAVALIAGLRVRWRVLAFGDGHAPFTHVYAEVAPPEGNWWCELDVTRPVALPGMMLKPSRDQIVEL